MCRSFIRLISRCCAALALVFVPVTAEIDAWVAWSWYGEKKEGAMMTYISIRKDFVGIHTGPKESAPVLGDSSIDMKLALL